MKKRGTLDEMTALLLVLPKKKGFFCFVPPQMVEGGRNAKRKALMVLAATGASNILSKTIEVACSLENNQGDRAQCAPRTFCGLVARLRDTR